MIYSSLKETENNEVLLKVKQMESADSNEIAKTMENELVKIKHKCFGKVKINEEISKWS